MISSLELARLCGVSQGTVDRALHNRGRIRPETRERILARAARHGYVPNPAARELMTGSSRMVAAVAPSFSSVFFMDVMDTLHTELRRHGLELVLSTAGNAVETLALLREFAARRVRSVVVVPPIEKLSLPPLLAASVPLVALVNPLPGAIPFVGPDEERTGIDGVRYLRSKGHTRILFVSYARRSWAIMARERGYQQAMQRARQPSRLLLQPDANTLLRAVDTYRPTALFCHNDWLALAAIRTLTAHGMQVPAQLSVLGVDNSAVFNMLYPGLTTLTYPSASIARAVAAHILGHKPVPRVDSCRVVERETVTPVQVSARASRRQARQQRQAPK